MAKLVTTKEKYGVSVGARIDPNLAHQISERAERLGVSMAKMLAILISSGFNPPNPIQVEDSEEIQRLKSEFEEAQSQIHQKEELYAEVAAEFITRVGDSDSGILELASLYNEILQEKKSAHE